MTAYREWVEANFQRPAAPDASIAVIEAPVPLVIPSPSDVVVDGIDRGFVDEYSAVASSIGFAPVALSRDVVRLWFADEGIRVYDRTQVAEFLDEQLGETDWDEDEDAFAKWTWRPMRESDRASDHSVRYFQNNEIANWLESYRKPIPLPVLLTAKRVLDRFPDAKFFVSDDVSEYELPPRDPFLLASIGGVELIIERWDEPNYRER